MEAWQETLIGLIWMVVLGPAVGNYATSVIYRLPFGQTPFEKNPYCGDCGSMLQPKDLFPILSWLSTLGKCRYCGVLIRPSYTVVEVVCGIIFVVNYLCFGISEQFLLITSLAVFLVILAALAYHEKKLFLLIWTYVVALGAVLRVLQDGSIYPLVYSAFAMLFVSVVIWRAAVWFKRADAKNAPEFCWLAVMVGVCIPLESLWCVSALGLVLYTLQRMATTHVTTVMAASVALYVGLVWVY